ncbi:MAG TPA: aldehyde dehydrogenase family protein, partial [Bryobacteraceae bacterium]|nr:aldehyde dehydrogenase family protein [Bryobacteraceae bacterium]
MRTATYSIPDILEKLHIEAVNSGACYGDWIPNPSGGEFESLNPSTGEPLAKVARAGPEDYEYVVERAQEAFLDWRMIPAPKRGEVVRGIANELRAHKADLGALVSLEMGKILAEGLGEVQEMIDIADFSVGLSRQLYGLTMHSERPGHRMYEQWHPLGIVGVISAFNFPVAVWSWNAMIAAVCGDCVLWRPSSETPLTAIAVQKICNRVTDRHGLKGIFNLVIGPSRPIGETLIHDARIPLISFTGSTEVGRHVSEVVA